MVKKRKEKHSGFPLPKPALEPPGEQCGICGWVSFGLSANPRQELPPCSPPLGDGECQPLQGQPA